MEGKKRGKGSGTSDSKSSLRRLWFLRSRLTQINSTNTIRKPHQRKSRGRDRTVGNERLLLNWYNAPIWRNEFRDTLDPTNRQHHKVPRNLFCLIGRAAPIWRNEFRVTLDPTNLQHPKVPRAQLAELLRSGGMNSALP
jgi:hypothetical protein